MQNPMPTGSFNGLQRTSVSRGGGDCCHTMLDFQPSWDEEVSESDISEIITGIHNHWLSVHNELLHGTAIAYSAHQVVQAADKRLTMQNIIGSLLLISCVGSDLFCFGLGWCHGWAFDGESSTRVLSPTSATISGLSYSLLTSAIGSGDLACHELTVRNVRSKFERLVFSLGKRESDFSNGVSVIDTSFPTVSFDMQSPFSDISGGPRGVDPVGSLW